MTKKNKRSLKSLSQKGMLGIGDIMMLGIGTIILYIAIIIFIPFANMLGNVTTNMTNGGIFMAIVWTIPLVIVGLFIYSFAQKSQMQ